MFSFISSHLSQILACILIFINLLTFIVLFCKSPKKVASYLVAIYEKLPDLILIAEKLGFVDGDCKKTYVLKEAINYLVSLTGWSEKVIVNLFSSSINSAIENILACPQKKGA